MDGADIFRSALAQATTIVKQVRADQFANATPDTEWNVRDLVGHMLNEICWAPDMVAGKTIKEVGSRYDGDLIGESDLDLSVNWQAAADKAEAAVDAADGEETAHLSYGDVTIDEYLQDLGTDLLIHAWDLGKSIGVPVRFDGETAEEVYSLALPKLPSMRSSGLFAEPVSVGETADIQTKLLGLFGRDSQWQPQA